MPLIEVRPDVPPAVVKVIDRMMATKPADRFQTAADAADALANLDRPRTRTAPRKAVPRDPDGRAPDVASPVETNRPSLLSTQLPETPLPAPPPQVVTVRPSYPFWFRPLAQLAEQSPVAAFFTVAGALGVTFVLGVAAALLLG